MKNNELGKIIKITGARILILVTKYSIINKVAVDKFMSNYISIGSLVGTNLVDNRTLIMTVEEIYDSDNSIFVTTSISGIYDAISKIFTFGTNSYPLLGEKVFKADNEILKHIFNSEMKFGNATIGKYLYDLNVSVGYNPNVLFGKHLGVFGNTGSGKTCTVVSVIQNFIRTNPHKNIKFIILDVNGEYATAFHDYEAEYIPFDKLRFHHTILSNPEYGRLFKAADGVQYPALKDCIEELRNKDEHWTLNSLPEAITRWIQGKGNDNFSKNQLNGYLRTMNFRIDSVIDDKELMSVIDSTKDTDTVTRILNTKKKVLIFDLQVSSEALDIVTYMFFKAIYKQKTKRDDLTHFCLVLEEAHRYINNNTEESRLGSYYIDKLSREGRKFSVGLIIASQVPSMLASDIVSQCNSVVMHKITSRKDLEFLRGILRVSNDTFYLQMSALEKQHAIVCGEAFSNDSVVRIHDAHPLPRSNDPIIIDFESVKS